MAREIKFRAWQCTHKYMTDDITMLQDSKSTDFYYGDPEDGMSMRDDWELMQSTGLKDKDGKEIYEGDIGVSDKGTQFIVLWIDDLHGFYMKTSLYGKECFDFREYMMIEFKVIGNIYENPELIK